VRRLLEKSRKPLVKQCQINMICQLRRGTMAITALQYLVGMLCEKLLFDDAQDRSFQAGS
jgi:hypothetical protein